MLKKCHSTKKNNETIVVANTIVNVKQFIFIHVTKKKSIQQTKANREIKIP